MNKLLVSDIIDLVSGEYVLDCTSNNIEINIKGNVTIYLINVILEKLKINLEENSKLNVYNFSNNVNNKLEVSIYQNDNSNIMYNSSYISNNDNELIVNNYIRGNNNESNINIRNISESGLSKIIINVEIDEYTKNNIALEDLKGINNGGFVHIEPNIIANSNEVVANHLTTIGGIDKDMQNYLLSKGISEKKVKELLLKSFIYGNMDDYIRGFLGGE